MAGSRIPGPIGAQAGIGHDLRPTKYVGAPHASFCQAGPIREGGLTPEEEELALDVAQIVLDIVGIFEPTPFADGTNALISIGRGDWLGATLSGISIIPYIGDLAKFGKLPRYSQKLYDAIRLARNHAEFAKLVRPALENLKKVVDSIPTDISPELTKMVNKIKRPLDSYLGLAKVARRLSLTERLVIARLGSLQNVGDLVWRNIETARNYFIYHWVPEKKMIEALKGMDVHNTIEIGGIKKGDVIRQAMQNPDEPGEWFLKAGSGVGEESMAIAHGNRVVKDFEVLESQSVLISKAYDIDDAFTVGGHKEFVKKKIDGKRQWVERPQAGKGGLTIRKAQTELVYDPQTSQIKVKAVRDKKTKKFVVSTAVTARGGGTQYYLPKSAQTRDGRLLLKVTTRAGKHGAKPKGEE